MSTVYRRPTSGRKKDGLALYVDMTLMNDAFQSSPRSQFDNTMNLAVTEGWYKALNTTLRVSHPSIGTSWTDCDATSLKSSAAACMMLHYYFAHGSGCEVLLCLCLSVSLSVCLSVCPRGYLRNHTRDRYQIFVHVACVCASVFLMHVDDRPHRLSPERGFLPL